MYSLSYTQLESAVQDIIASILPLPKLNCLTPSSSTSPSVLALENPPVRPITLVVLCIINLVILPFTGKQIREVKVEFRLTITDMRIVTLIPISVYRYSYFM
jgi:hypothetical protein